MKRLASFASIMCMLLSACGAGVTDQPAPQTRAQTAGDIMDSAATDASSEPGPEQSNPRPEQTAEASEPLAAAPAPAPAPPVRALSASPAVIYIN